MNNEEGLSMREVDRVEVIREVLGRRLRPGEGSERLRICVRQVKRLVRRYREEGARGLRSRRRGRRASNAIAPELRREILGVVRERYEDFAPTLAWEKFEPPRVYRRLYSLRGWSHEQVDKVLPGGSGESGTHGVRASGGTRFAVGGNGFGGIEAWLFGGDVAQGGAPFNWSPAATPGDQHRSSCCGRIGDKVG